MYQLLFSKVLAAAPGPRLPAWSDPQLANARGKKRVGELGDPWAIAGSCRFVNCQDCTAKSAKVWSPHIRSHIIWSYLPLSSLSLCLSVFVCVCMCVCVPWQQSMTLKPSARPAKRGPGTAQKADPPGSTRVVRKIFLVAPFFRDGLIQIISTYRIIWWHISLQFSIKFLGTS